jgi:Tfp pilus assembly protein PilO
MPRSFLKLPAGLTVKDPRIAMRAVIGVLLVANVAAALVAFKPFGLFGGSADDLRHQQQALSAQLSQRERSLARTKQIVEKVQRARTEGDGFLGQYFSDENTTAAMIVAELYGAAKEAGIKMGTVTWTREAIEGSDTLMMLTSQIGFEGNYANLTKFVNLVDKSQRFMIIENMQAAAPQQQGGQALNVTLKIDTFVKGAAGGMV